MKYADKMNINHDLKENSSRGNSKELGMYASLPADYYARRVGSMNPNDIWFDKRQAITRSLVKKYYAGGTILDIGCGNCLWNREGLPTIGVDVNKNMLDHNSKNIKNFTPLLADISNGLPLESGKVQMVVITEFLEHLPGYPSLIHDIWRVLSPGGMVVASVPYGRFPGLWSFLFPLWCKYKYFKDKDEYYLNRCGHKVNFDHKSLADAFNGFSRLEKKTLAMMTIFAVFRKDQAQGVQTG